MYHCHDFTITKEEKDNTPSFLDGISPLEEGLLRSSGCDLIEEGGLLLRLPQVVMCTAQILFQRFSFGCLFFSFFLFFLYPFFPPFLPLPSPLPITPPPPTHTHRFYFRVSLLNYNMTNLAMAALFLASKLEESPRRSRSILTVFHHLKQRCLQKGRKGGEREKEGKGERGGGEGGEGREGGERGERGFVPLELGGCEYVRGKEELFRSEQDLLVVMGFRVHCRHPHKFMLPYARIVELEEERDVCLFIFCLFYLLLFCQLFIFPHKNRFSKLL